MYKLLIVEDEYFSREVIKHLIDWEKYSVEIVDTAENGKIGLQKILCLKPDIVLTDIRMKLVSGLEMIEEANKHNVKCKFIIMSGYKKFEYAQKAVDEDVIAYLLKPVRQENLTEAIIKVTKMLEKDSADYDLTGFHESERKFDDFIKQQSGNETARIFFICKAGFEEISYISSELRQRIFAYIQKTGKEAYVKFGKNCFYMIVLNENITKSGLTDMMHLLEKESGSCTYTASRFFDFR